jgi:hypothetical protein
MLWLVSAKLIYELQIEILDWNGLDLFNIVFYTSSFLFRLNRQF